MSLKSPLSILGDIHGQFDDLIQLFSLLPSPSSSSFLFLGDYVDRGKESLQTILLLLCYKILYPSKFFLLRGNHECASINRIYGFYDECKRKFTLKLWKEFTTVFNYLPVAAIIENRIFCMHGGLSPDLDKMETVGLIFRPTDVPDTGILCDLLWSDPEEGLRSWKEND